MKTYLSRDLVIDHAIYDLRDYKEKAPQEEHYAIDENITFFEATRKIFSYYIWLFTRAPKIDGNKLLEIQDFQFTHWDKIMHASLAALQRKPFPGLLKPLVNRIRDIIHEEDRPLVLANLGCGSMEVERQIIKSLVEEGNDTPIIFIGIDKSSSMHSLARTNLSELGDAIRIHEVKTLDSKILKELMASHTAGRLAILCYDDALNLEKYFHPGEIDLIYHSLFKHHLDEFAQTKMESSIMKIGKRALEYDGIRSWFFMTLPHTLTAWQNPIFLNASIFSDLRYKTKKQLLKHSPGWNISFTSIATYLREYTSIK